MSCKDCVHYDACKDMYDGSRDDFDDDISAEFCDYFKNKADFVEVVRCRECKYWQDNNGGYPHDECRWGKDETPDADDFCSYGERKENE